MKLATPSFTASVFLATGIFSTLFPGHAHAQGAVPLKAINELHRRADATFASGDHAAAAKLYEKLIK